MIYALYIIHDKCTCLFLNRAVFCAKYYSYIWIFLYYELYIDRNRMLGIKRFCFLCSGGCLFCGRMYPLF